MGRITLTVPQRLTFYLEGFNFRELQRGEQFTNGRILSLKRRFEKFLKLGISAANVYKKRARLSKSALSFQSYTFHRKT
jgi:hypothetical protein